MTLRIIRKVSMGARRRPEEGRQTIASEGLNVPVGEGAFLRYGFSLIPAWLKLRWRGGVLQPAKLYMKASAGPLR